MLRFGESNAPYWLAEPPEWRPVAGALSTIGEVWTPTRRVGTAYASPGPGSVLVVADRASPSPWREVVGGRDAFLTVIDAVDKPRGQTVVIGLTSEPEVKSSIRLITVDAAGRAGAPHLLVPSLGMVGSVRTARVADGTVAIAWVTARAKGSALSLARVSTDTGELVGTPFEVDADEALHPYVAEMALAADGPGVALAWAVHGAKKPTHDREVLLELRIFTQGAPGEAPRRASSRDVSTEEDQSSYTPGALLPIMLEAASLDLHALFAWRPSHESTSLDVLVLGAASPLAVPVPPESYLTLRSLGLVAYAPIKNGLHIMKTSCR